MTIQTGTQLGAYEIFSPLGAGGMGEVHRARDSRLNREVAIKVLPTDFANDADRLRRFEQEALATSALNHPNILTIYEFGSVTTEAGATHFLASEFIDGEPLRNRLQRTPLTLNEAIDIAVQTAQALAAAHEAHIIHRDIKPENVMLRKDGIVKVLDFGLAKLTEESGRRGEGEKGRQGEDEPTLPLSPPLPHSPSPPLTIPGTLMGTVAYMSPEQARGNPVDARTDLFSLGVMLYEMLARRQPFTGETINHVIVAILEKEPPPLAQDIPAELTRILQQALAKKAAERYPSAQTMLADLKKLQTRLLVEAENKRNSADDAPVEAQTLIQPQATAAAPEALATAAVSAQPTSSDHPKRKQWWLAAGLSLLLAVGGYFGYGYFTAARQINSIAVMPFENKNSDADTDYLSDGLAESVIFRLTQIPDLRVSPTSSVMRYKGKETDVARIASELGVDAVMTGRLTKRGDNLNITVELVDARTNKSLWGEKYERRLSELLTTQREMVAEIVSKLQLKLSGESEQKLAKKSTDNNEAYQLYLQGRFHWNKRTETDFEKAVVFFKQAIEKDPNYALAYSGLSDTYGLFPEYVGSRPKDYKPQAKQAALKALELDPNLAEAHISLGRVLFDYEYDFAGAEKLYKRAIELDPNYATAHQWYALLLVSSGRNDEAVRETTKAIDLDPFSMVINRSAPYYLLRAGRYDEALLQNKKSNELFPDEARFHLANSRIYAAQGKYDQAVDEYLLGAKVAKNFKPENIVRLKEAYEKGGWDGFGRMRQEILLEQLNIKQAKDPNGYVAAMDYANAYALGKDKDKTIEYLNKAYDERDWQLLGLKVEKHWDFVRDDPRFKELVRKVGIPE